MKTKKIIAVLFAVMLIMIPVVSTANLHQPAVDWLWVTMESPVIEIVELGDESFSVLDNFTALSHIGEDITAYANVDMGDFNVDVPGVYNIRFTLPTLSGWYSERIMTVVVTDGTFHVEVYHGMVEVAIIISAETFTLTVSEAEYITIEDILERADARIWFVADGWGSVPADLTGNYIPVWENGDIAGGAYIHWAYEENMLEVGLHGINFWANLDGRFGDWMGEYVTTYMENIVLVISDEEYQGMTPDFDAEEDEGYDEDEDEYYSEEDEDGDADIDGDEDISDENGYGSGEESTPNTGDNTNIVIYTVLLLASVVGIALYVWAKKK